MNDTTEDNRQDYALQLYYTEMIRGHLRARIAGFERCGCADHASRCRDALAALVDIPKLTPKVRK